MNRFWLFCLIIVLIVTTSFTDVVFAVVPNTPSITSPIVNTYNNSRTLTLTSSTFSGAPAHTTSDWKVATDSGGTNIVWSKDDDATNLESIVVNNTNGTFAGDLSGETQLGAFTEYYGFVRHTNADGDSSWSSGILFTTLYSESLPTQTWEFNEGTPTDAYDYNASNIQVNDSSNSLVELAPQTNFSELSGVLDKRRAVVIENPGATLTDYQVEVSVVYDSDMQVDFDDIRFTQSDGTTELDYWLEEKTDSTSATFWVEVNSLTTGNNTIYMYYGDAGLSTTSNIDNTFLFADDFDDGTVDSGKWTTTGAVTESGGELLLNADEGVWATSFEVVDDTFTTFKLNLGSSSQRAHYGYVDSANRFEEDLDSGEKGFLFNPWSNGTTYIERGSSTFEQTGAFSTIAGENEFALRYDDGNRINFYYPVGKLFTETTSTTIADSSDDVHLQIYSNTHTDMRADYVHVRKFVVSDLVSEVMEEEDSITYIGVGFDSTSAPASTTKRQPITLTNTGSTLTDYQVELSVLYDSDMQADFDDLRFTQSDGTTLIDHWTKEYTASDLATVWVEIPSIPNGSSIIYMYYGDGSAVSASSAANTLLWYDDFSTDTLASYTEYGGSWSHNVGGYVEAPSSNPEAALEIASITDADILVEVEGRQNDDDGIGAMVRFNSMSEFYSCSVHETSDSCSIGEDEANSSLRTSKYLAHDVTDLVSARMTITGTTLTCTCKDSNGYTAITSTADTSIVSGSPAISSSYNDPKADIESVFVAKYSSSHPTAEFGLEQDSNDKSNIDVFPKAGGVHPTFARILSFSESLGGANAGTVTYQMSNNGTDWYYNNSGSWASVTDNHSHTNTAAEINSYIPGFNSEIGTGDVYFRAFLESSGSQKTEIDSLVVTYDTGAPSGLGDFEKSNNTSTVATLGWTAATETAFDHYEIWYGTDQSDVQNRTGTASEWDDGNDSNLATVSTITTDITGLTTGQTYFAKIWAIDAFEQEATVSDIQFVMTVGGGSPKVVPKATFHSDSGGGVGGTSEEDPRNIIVNNNLDVEKKGLERLGIRLNTPEEETWIAVADNEMMQRSEYIQISQLDNRLDELIVAGNPKVYFIFKYKGVLSPVYSKDFDEEKPEITEVLIDDLESKIDDGSNEVDEIIEEFDIEMKQIDGHAIAEIVKLKPGECFLINGNDAVYYFSEEGKRHVFPNENVYYSYYENFDNILNFNEDQVGAIPLGQNKIISPGTWLVKIATDPKVYAVEPGGILRWVQSEEIAENLYGSQWNKKILDVDDSQFADYEIGAPIVEAVHPDGVLITFDEDKSSDNDVIYYVRDSQLFEVSNHELEAFGARKNFIEVLDEDQFNYIKAGVINNLL